MQSSKFTVSLALIASGFVSHASAATVVYTDRTLWESAISNTITTEDFNGLTPGAIASDTTTSIGQLSIQTINTHNGTQINDGTDSVNVDGSIFLRVATDGSPVRSANLIFAESIYAWGMDFSVSVGDPTYVSFLDVNEYAIASNSTGFIGFISDTAFNQVTLTDPNVSFSVIGIDNLSYVSAVPVPAAVWLFGSGLIGLIGIARRKKA